MLAAATVLALLAQTAFAAPARLNKRDSPLAVSLAAPTSVDDIDDLKITATIENTGTETLTLVNDPQSLLSTWKTNSFSIDGTSADFTGVMVKVDPLKTARTVLAPGESATVEHELAGAYAFTSAGSLDIAPISSVFTLVDADSNLSSVEASVSGTSTALSGSGKLVSNAAMAVAKTGEKMVKNNLASEKRETYDSCTASEKTSIVAAANGAQTYASEAYSYLSSNTASTTRYTTWFGAYTAARHTTVTTHFSNLNSGDYSNYEYNCGCDEEGTFAYTYPAQYGLVYLCPVFWDAPTTGTDSKAGTLIHESTHFNKNAGTQDYVYGQTNAKSLAKSNPGEAVMNADNHEYFAENNPSQS